jgi:hypothetical protein
MVGLAPTVAGMKQETTTPCTVEFFEAAAKRINRCARKRNLNPVLYAQLPDNVDAKRTLRRGSPKCQVAVKLDRAAGEIICDMVAGLLAANRRPTHPGEEELLCAGLGLN